MYLGTIIPFKEFHQPETTGLTIGILFALGVLVLIFRRIPGVFILYKAMPSCVGNWKEALFMGYFGPIGSYSLHGSADSLANTQQELEPSSMSNTPNFSFLRNPNSTQQTKKSTTSSRSWFQVNHIQVIHTPLPG